jgi:hypothetical protein
MVGVEIGLKIGFERAREVHRVVWRRGAITNNVQGGDIRQNP